MILLINLIKIPSISQEDLFCKILTISTNSIGTKKKEVVDNRYMKERIKL